MQDRTINNALLALRRKIITGGFEGQEHVDALLAERGVETPTIYHMNAASRGAMAELVLACLQDGPKTMRELAAYVAERRPEISTKDTYRRTGMVLARLKRVGVVRRECRLWQSV